RPDARERRPDRDIERDLLVRRPLGIEVGGRIAAERLEDLGRGGAGIGGRDLDARLPRTTRDRLVAHQRQDVHGWLGARLSVHCGSPPEAEISLCADFHASRKNDVEGGGATNRSGRLRKSWLRRKTPVPQLKALAERAEGAFAQQPAREGRDPGAADEEEPRENRETRPRRRADPRLQN